MSARTAAVPFGIAVAILGTLAVALIVRRSAGVDATPAGEPAAVRAAAEAELPRAPLTLAETGLYDASGVIARGNEPYAPQYPLWSDGAVKSRWIHLPEGARLDVSDVDVWRFPVGTKLWKEFDFAGRKVETRMLWQPRAGEWVFATYVWNQEQSEARLAPEDGVPDVLEITPGRRHTIPGLADCRNCHGSSPAIVLGFDALQLSDDRDPLAPHSEPLPPGAVTLAALVAGDRLAPPRPEWVQDPPRIRTSDPTVRAALGYLSVNCGNCHNSSGSLARLDLDLLHDVAGDERAPEPALRTALDAPTRYPVPGTPPDRSRVVAPGAPEHSTLLYRMQSRRPSSQMPPLGTVVVDDEAVRLVEKWIAGMKTTQVP